MLAGFVNKLRRFRWGRGEAPSGAARPSRSRLILPGDPELIYAIGDVHGCLAQLKALEARIVEDAAAYNGLKLIVMLGDYIDRGSESAAVLDHLTRPPPEGFRRICLCGNHEDIFQRFLNGELPFEAWLDFGGEQTLLSYGLDLEGLASRGRGGRARLGREILETVPLAHRIFLDRLPVALSTPSYYFVHAGARPGVALEAQGERDLLWIRQAFLESEIPFEKVVIYGHTPVAAPSLVAGRIGIDTGAYMGGPLTAARIFRGRVRFLQVR